MSSTYVYLSKKDLDRLMNGKSVDIPVTPAIKHSRLIFLRVDPTEKAAYDEKHRELISHIQNLRKKGE